MTRGRAKPNSGDHPPPPRTDRGRRTRERLIQAAEEVFGDVGYYEAHIAEITRKAGVALGTFYLYFSSKEELFRALLASLNHRLRQRLRTRTEGLPTRAAMEEEGMREFFRFMTHHRKLYRIVKQAEAIDPTLYREYYARIARGYRAGLTAAMDRGELRRFDPELVAYALMGMADFAASRYVVWEPEPLDGKADELADLILHGLLPPETLTGDARRRTARAPARRAGTRAGGS